MIIFTAFAAIFKPLSSVSAAMSIIACSNEVSFKSAAVDNVLLKVPAIVGCEVLKRVTPSPELKIQMVNHCLMVQLL